MIKLSIVAFIAAITLATSSCGPKEEVTVKITASGHEEKSTDRHTTFLTEEQVKTIGIEFGRIEDKQLTASLKANGILQVPNQNKASVNSVYSGIIKSLVVQPGNTVKKGQLIATIANPHFIEMQGQYLDVAARVGLAELEATRQQELNAGNAGALKNLQAAETNVRTLRSAKAALAQQIKLMGVNPDKLSNGHLVSVLSVKSPISGVVSTVMVKMGSYVDLTTPVAEIVDNSQLHLDLFVYEKDLPKLKNNQLIHFTVTNNPGKEYDAQIFSLGSSFEDESKAVTVHARVQGDKTSLIDGMNITAVISLEKATAPAVSAEAIVTIQGQDYIFITTEEKPGTKDAENEEAGISFERIPVARGTSDVGFSEITLLKKIPSDARVVVKGAFFVSAKMSDTGEDEHEH